MRRTITCLAVVVAASTVLLTVVPAHATAPGKNGRIAFRRYFNAAHTYGAIFTIDPDGGGLRQVTHPHQGVLTTDPDWSPNGRWIAYDRVANDTSRIYKKRADGTDKMNLSGSCTGECLSDLGPAFSRNGARIAFTRGAGTCTGEPGDRCLVTVQVRRADGTHVRRVTQPDATTAIHNRYEDNWPQWGPHDRRIAFERRDNNRLLGPDLQAHAIFTVRLDGTHLRRLTPWRLDAAQPDWSPNGRWILFRSHENGDRQNNLYLVHPDGSDLHRVTHTFTGGEPTATWGHATFSPDGTMITASHKPGVGKPGNPDVWVMNLDGSGLRDVTNSVIWDSAPDWGPRPR